MRTAADADVSIGDGPDVRGDALSLLLGVCGPRLALGDLEQPGADSLAAVI